MVVRRQHLVRRVLNVVGLVLLALLPLIGLANQVFGFLDDDPGSAARAPTSVVASAGQAGPNPAAAGTSLAEEAARAGCGGLVRFEIGLGEREPTQGELVKATREFAVQMEIASRTDPSYAPLARAGRDLEAFFVDPEASSMTDAQLDANSSLMGATRERLGFGSSRR